MTNGGRDIRPPTWWVGQNYQKSMDKQNSSPSSSWGGSRAGAGRKPVEHGKSITFRATPEVDAFLSSYKGNKAKFINDAITKAIAGVEK